VLPVVCCCCYIESTDEEGVHTPAQTTDTPVVLSRFLVWCACFVLLATHENDSLFFFSSFSLSSSLLLQSGAWCVVRESSIVSRPPVVWGRSVETRIWKLELFCRVEQ